MKPYLINLLNALVLILMGSWSYFTSEHPSVTALIPVFAGIILISITPGFKKGNRVLAHIAVALTFLLLIAFIKPLTGAISRHDDRGIVRVSIMMATSLIAMICFVLSFIKARVSVKNNS
jgi:hypothetical protein